MKKYCSKETVFISDKYSGKIYKHQCQMDFLDRKPQLKEVLNNPYIWQEFVRKELLNKVADDRTVDWIIDPVGNTGKSSFAWASDPSKIISATALMEDAKSGHLETTFGGNHKEIEIPHVHIV